MRGYKVLVGGALLLLLSACGAEDNPTGPFGIEVATTGGTYSEISVGDLQAMSEGDDFTLVNVHIPFEGDLPGTDLSVPFDEIDQHLDQLPDDKDAAIVLYCRSDRMSTIASETLVGLGYTNVSNLDGGMVAWESLGRPIEGR